MRTISAIFLLLGLASPALADWQMEDEIAVALPSENTSNIEMLAIMCGDPFHVEVHTREGPILTTDGKGATDYFYQPGRIEAEIDGQFFPLVAAGSGEAVVLFAEGDAARNYMAPVGHEFIAGLRKGSMLTLAFDITEAPSALDDSPFETYARFPLAEAAAVLDEALRRCQ